MFPLKDTVRSRSVPVINYLIIVVNVLVFLFELSLGSSGLDSLIGSVALVPRSFVSHPGLGSFAAIFASMFLHAGWLHLIGNMWALFIFGDNVEDRMGHLRYLVFYLLAGVAAGLVDTYVQPSSTIPVVGASGAIAGIMGAYLLLYPTARVLTLIPVFVLPWLVEIPAVIFIGLWFLLQLVSGVASLTGNAGGVAFWAHVGGFLFGLLTVKLFAWRSASRPFHRDEYYPW
jgi:membrane associated rhomboid family serine protease